MVVINFIKENKEIILPLVMLSYLFGYLFSMAVAYIFQDHLKNKTSEQRFVVGFLVWLISPITVPLTLIGITTYFILELLINLLTGVYQWMREIV